MNFSEFSFWWILSLLILPMLIGRHFAIRYQFWQSRYDRVGIMLVSLILFWNAAHSSFIIYGLELAFNYIMVRQMQKQSPFNAKLIATLTIGVSLIILIYFKYLTFFLEDVISLNLRGESLSVDRNLLSADVTGIPPGISFYTFQMVSFVVDSLQCQEKKVLGLVDYINFTSFFPQVVAGPIERRQDLLPQLQSFRFQFSWQNLNQGLEWLAFGFFIKLVLGDNLAPFVNLEETVNVWSIWLSVFLFSLRIYFDFAGYSFIALGLARMFGVQLSINFLAPYTALNIQEFWRRWHITLSTWFRDYLFIPLGGSRVPWVAVNIFTVFVISGLWHGAGWNFIFWGAYHGVLLIIHRYVGRSLSLPGILSWAVTLFSVMFGWLFFMETNLDRLTLKLQTLFHIPSYSIGNILSAIQSINNLTGLLFIATLSILVLALEFLAGWRDRDRVYKFHLLPQVTPIWLALTLLLAAKASSQFVYFAF
jgi:D-alanyl-lipoteichoic acid acyltransferase DltB (MBOAT superfamily)